MLNALAPCSAPPPSLWRAVAFIHTSRRRNRDMGGGLAEVGAGSGDVPLCLALPNTAQIPA